MKKVKTEMKRRREKHETLRRSKLRKEGMRKKEKIGNR